MNDLLAQPPQYDLLLADGSHWVIAAGDEEAASVVSQLGGAMLLRVMRPSAARPAATSGTGRTGAVEPAHQGSRRLLVVADVRNPEASPATCCAPFRCEADGFLVCVLRSSAHGDGLFVQLVGLSSVIAHDAQTRGGVLLHGALAEKGGVGVILAAPGGTGKTTASARLPAPWRSLCDDNTLVVRDSQGDYWAHPWPTWSRFLGGESGGAWDVQHAVPLKGIFLLSQAVDDRVESVGPGHAVSLLVECAEQTSQLMARGLSQEEARALHVERFNNLCALAPVVPTHVLRISVAGAFWREIEQAIDGSPGEGT